jgi:hypothetical protein
LAHFLGAFESLLDADTNVDPQFPGDRIHLSHDGGRECARFRALNYFDQRGAR